jgi:hypothetical protein
MFLNLDKIKPTDHNAVRDLLEDGFKHGVGIEYITGPTGSSGYLEAILQADNVHPLSYVNFLDLSN